MARVHDCREVDVWQPDQKSKMSSGSYLEEADTDSDSEVVCPLTEDEIFEIKAQCNEIKLQGNQYFSEKNYEMAIERYSVGLRGSRMNPLRMI
jgi:hypothetical protein